MAAVPSIGRADRAIPREADLTRALYERHAQQIFRYCLHQLGSREEAEDAVQSTFLNAFRGIKRGIVPEHESAWLFKIAENVCLSRRRSTWRRGRVESPTDFEVVEELAPAPSRLADELVGLQDVLEGMPENQRRAILLREWQGLSYREIGEELELSQTAVETLIFRARRSLAKGLEAPPEPAQKRRMVRGADLGNLLTGLTSLLLGGGAAAAKVAAVVVVVGAGTTVVASSPAKHHAARVHHAPPAATAPVAPARIASIGFHRLAPVRHAPKPAAPRPAHVGAAVHSPTIPAEPSAPVDVTPPTTPAPADPPVVASPFAAPAGHDNPPPPPILPSPPAAPPATDDPPSPTPPDSGDNGPGNSQGGGEGQGQGGGQGQGQDGSQGQSGQGQGSSQGQGQGGGQSNGGGQGNADNGNGNGNGNGHGG
ncbi:MAG TPA: RNA polymerase sigma factor, partial [Gaiellaceae bacterium]